MGYITGHGGMAFGTQIQRTTVQTSYPCDMMVGKGFMYIVHQNLNNIYIHSLNDETGIIGGYIATRNWYSQDTTIHQICRSNSSVPSAYAIYIKDGKNYLIGWSGDNNNIYEWEIDANHSISSSRRTIYNSNLRRMPWYSRAGWDGNRYVYFISNEYSSRLYRFDIETKEIKELYSWDDMNGYTSSYTGSGLKALGGRQPWWPDGTNEGGCVSWKSYNSYGGGNWNLSNFSGATGVYYPNNNASMHFHPYLPIAYTSNWGYNTVSAVSLCYPEIKLQEITNGMKNAQYVDNIKFRQDWFDGNEKITLNFDFAYEGDLSHTYGVGNNSYAYWRYKVYLNDVLVPGYTGWNGYKYVPFSDAISIDRVLFKDGENKLTIEAHASAWGSSGHQLFLRDFYMFVENNKLEINASLSTTEIHNEAVLLSCEINNEIYDKTNYQILINDEIYQDWTEDDFMTFPGFFDKNDQEFGNPITFVKRILPEFFISGANTIKIKASEHENFMVNEESTEIVLDLTKNNTIPTLDVQLVGRSLHINADDLDGDKLRWRVFVDGNQIAPADGWSIAFEPPFSTIYRLPRNVIRFNQDQEIKVEVMDICGDITTWTQTANIDYSGLIFTDRNGTYYSNDIGEVLQYLNMGIVVARTKSPIHKVYLQNNLGYTVNDIHLKPLYDDLDPINEIIELSKNEEPFVPLQELIYDRDLAHGEKIPIFVRLNLLPEAGGGKSNFRVMATAAPL